MAEVEILHSLGHYFSGDRITNRAEFDSKLQFLVDLARSGDGRQKLAIAKAVPTLLFLSPQILPSIHESCWSSRTFNLYVKLLRNLCAGNPVNQKALVDLKGLEAIAPVVEILGRKSDPGGGSHKDGESPADASVQNTAIEGLQMVLQLLGNVAGLGELSQARIWECFFPPIFEIVAKVSSEKVQGPLCMILYTCCRDSDSRCTELSEGIGASIVALLLNRGAGDVSNAAPPNEWLEFLISTLCFANSCFPLLFCELGDTKRNAAETNGSSKRTGETDLPLSFTKEQASLLDVLNATLSAREEEKHSDDPSSEPPHHYTSMPSTSASFLIDIIRSAAKCAASTALPVMNLPTHSPVADVLGLSLSMTRILCALDETRSTILPKFASSGLVPLMLDLLRALGAPDSAKASTTATLDVDATLEEQSSSLSNGFEAFPRRDVYMGYRRDVVAVIANASHRSLLLQESVRENGGLLLVLQQCMPDTNNPLLREWGLWAIRNLLEGNSRNQSELADLEIRSAVPDSRLRDAGMSVEINPQTGRPRLVNVTTSTDNPAADEFI